MDITHLFGCRIYKITCLKNKKTYIGESKNLLTRIGYHCERLCDGKNECLDFQDDFNNYGKEQLTIEILNHGSEWESIQRRREREQYLIRENIKKNLNYNTLGGSDWIFHSQTVKVRGETYASLRQAARV